MSYYLVSGTNLITIDCISVEKESIVFTNLSIPSVIFADANWYGSIRGGVEFGPTATDPDADGRSHSAGSRWGIQGNTEVSDGLTAVYKFETRIGQGGASQDTNQLYVGLSGGFGSLTIGKFHNAAYLSGGMRDTGWWYGGSDVASKVGSTVSYAFSSDAATFQVDAIMDGGMDTGQSVDEFQLGMSLNLGDIGKIGFGYEDREDTIKMGMAKPVDMPAMGDDDPADDPTPTPPSSGMVQKTNAIAIELLPASGDTPVDTAQAGTLKVVNYVFTADNGAKKEVELYEAPSGSTYYLMNSDGTFTVQTDGFDPEKPITADQENDNTVISVSSKPGTDAKRLVPSDPNSFYQADQITIVTRTAKTGDSTSTPKTYYRVAKETLYYRTSNNRRYEFGTDEAPGDDGVMLTPVNEKGTDGDDGDDGDQMADPEPAPADPAPTPTPTVTTEVDKHGYTRTGVSAQFDLGGVTLGLGYSEKESNKKDSLDEKTTYVGLSGSAGDTGLTWRTQFRDVTNSGNTKGDANPWMVGIHKSLGGGAFTFVEHQNKDNGNGGNTVIALGVNF